LARHRKESNKRRKKGLNKTTIPPYLLGRREVGKKRGSSGLLLREGRKYNQKKGGRPEKALRGFRFKKEGVE